MGLLITKDTLSEWTRRLDQYRAGIVLYVLILLAATIVLVDELAGATPNQAILLSIFVAIPLVTLSLITHLRHWRYSSEALVIIISLLIGFTIEEPYLSGEASIIIFLPGVIAALACRRRSPVAWGTILTLVLLISRSGGQSAYLDPIGLVIIGLIVGGIFLTRIVLENTSEARQDAERLRQLSETYLKSIGDGVVAIDRDWSVTLFNPAAEKITGWTKAEAIGKPLREVLKFIKESDRSENILFIERALIEEKITTLAEPTLLIQKNGRETPVGESAAPIYDVNGKVNGAIIIFRDAAEERASTQLRSGFSYASHQLRTPATELNWVLETALAEKDPEKTKQAIKLAQNSLQSIVRLADELIEVSDIDQGTIALKSQEVTLAQVIENVKKELNRTMPGLNVALESAPSIKITTDPKLLERALFEVTKNALQYGKNIEPKISASMHENGLLLTINNAGKPIPPGEQALVFTKFFRGSNRDQKIPGAGLGLYIAKSYVEMLKGKMWFKSDAKGTEFNILLPK
ncbi:MAG TPA: ATP-binding protein [Candidatus Dormibacteraeota bacterium]|nr:ATP-binding protein [Candidatus Dormibacteraeota bacterium]